MISIIVAMDRERAIGKNGTLPWRISGDLRRFKEITLGNPVIMGRKTHESIGRALPGRRNVIITRQKDYQPDGECILVHSLREALDAVKEDEAREIFLIGGAEVYAQALKEDLVDKMYLTFLDATFGGDVFFPEFNETNWKETSRTETVEKIEGSEDMVICRFVTFERKK